MKNIKSLIAAAVLFAATAAFAQQPPLPSCISNAVYMLTDTNATFHDTGGSVTNDSTGTLSVAIDYNGCHTNPVVIGNVFLQCDVSRHCQQNENIWQCPPGNIIPITLPAFCNSIDVAFSLTFWGCCEVTPTYSNPQTCIPQDGVTRTSPNRISQQTPGSGKV